MQVTLKYSWDRLPKYRQLSASSKKYYFITFILLFAKIFIVQYDTRFFSMDQSGFNPEDINRVRRREGGDIGLF